MPAVVPSSYAGVPIHARGFALAAEYPSSWTPPDDGDWVESEHVFHVWHHRRFRRHAVWKPDSARLPTTELLYRLAPTSHRSGASQRRLGVRQPRAGSAHVEPESDEAR
jgi:hypothetical protein